MKNRYKIAFPTHLDMKYHVEADMMSSDSVSSLLLGKKSVSSNTEYELRAVIVHHGGADSGQCILKCVVVVVNRLFWFELATLCCSLFEAIVSSLIFYVPFLSKSNMQDITRRIRYWIFMAPTVVDQRLTRTIPKVGVPPPQVITLLRRGGGCIFLMRRQKQ